MRLAMILGSILLLLPAGEAFAHAQLVQANPAVGSTVSGRPTQIWLKFDQLVRVPPTAARLTWPDGHRVVIKVLSRDPRDENAVIAPTPSPLGPGRYELEWRALSVDGHSTQGQFGFTVRP